jgi:hypothetical protein
MPRKPWRHLGIDWRFLVQDENEVAFQFALSNSVPAGEGEPVTTGRHGREMEDSAVRNWGLSILFFTAACGSLANDQSDVVKVDMLKQKRLHFFNELSLLTYHSQCPEVHPLSLEAEARAVARLSNDLAARIENSPLKEELEASRRKMAQQASYSNESDCVGVRFPDDDRESVENYRGIFATERSKLKALQARFQDLSERIAG